MAHVTSTSYLVGGVTLGPSWRIVSCGTTRKASKTLRTSYFVHLKGGMGRTLPVKARC